MSRSHVALRMAPECTKICKKIRDPKMTPPSMALTPPSTGRRILPPYTTPL